MKRIELTKQCIANWKLKPNYNKATGYIEHPDSTLETPEENCEWVDIQTGESNIKSNKRVELTTLCIERMKRDPMYNKEDGLIHFPDSRFEDPAEYCEWADLQLDNFVQLQTQSSVKRLEMAKLCVEQWMLDPRYNKDDGLIWFEDSRFEDPYENCEWADLQTGSDIQLSLGTKRLEQAKLCVETMMLDPRYSKDDGLIWFEDSRFEDPYEYCEWADLQTDVDLQTQEDESRIEMAKICIEKWMRDPMYNKTDGLIHFSDSRFEDPYEYCEWADVQTETDIKKLALVQSASRRVEIAKLCVERWMRDPMYNKEDKLIHFSDSRFEDPYEYCEWADLQVKTDIHRQSLVQ